MAAPAAGKGLTMRIFLAGATGAVGRGLVPALVAAGHEVVGTTRHPARAEAIRAAGGEPAVLDPLDRAAVTAAVTAARPDVVMHQLTALTGVADLKRMDAQFAVTNTLRTTGLDILLDAAVAAGARRFIAQSFSGWPNARTGGPVATEDHPLDPDPAPQARRTLAAIRHIETVVPHRPGIEGVVLRYGFFYGPGTAFRRGGELVEMVRRRRFPVVGAGTGVWSFIHVADAVSATVAAVERGTPGIYNVVDDEPAPVAEWLPYLARVTGAPRPLRIPVWLARPLIGEMGVRMMTSVRGSSNAKARSELDWTPAFPSWREGFRTGLR
ncbi:MAG: NAD(P)-dependent oxidoreductase [Micromonosporaceae bacterium]